MRSSGRNILGKLQKKWLLRSVLQILLYATGFAFLIYALSSNIVFGILTFAFVLMATSLVLKPWNYNLSYVSKYLDVKLPDLEFSTSLLLQEEEKLSPLARIQREKISHEISEVVKGLGPERSMKKAMITASFLLAGAWLISFFGIHDMLFKDHKDYPEQQIIFSSSDSIQRIASQPKVMAQGVRINYPRYTGKAIKRSENMNVKELQGSIITWSLEFDKKISSATLQYKGENKDLTLSEGAYQHSIALETSGFYNFKFTDTLGKAYYSELYSIESVEDESPEINISGLSQFTSFDIDQNKELSFRALISDDYGVESAMIIATVSKGSGESVKFREERLEFDDEIPTENKKITLRKKIDLDKMQMDPGDELYFYVEVVDVKKPKPNITRGETYFANIRDTITDVFEVDGSMGVDQMPDYFRSQRQLIIDTEKLIKEKPLLSKKEFNSKSNELAFDQKALRIKYGEFMGDESTLPMAEAEEAVEDGEENILAEYEHAHDTENESNLVDEHEDHDDEEEHGEEEEEDPLHTYTHNHDDPEEATLYTTSLKAQLRMALNEMWDAELHLRLYHPAESLPVQYSILKRLQEIKNSARIYVHRIGFDPPPIKEDKRLSGDLSEVQSFKKTEKLEQEELYPSIRTSISRIEEMLVNDLLKNKDDSLLFEAAGNELAVLAIEQPGDYLISLQSIKKLSQGFQLSKMELIELQKGLMSALPSKESLPEKEKGKENILNKLFIQELEVYD